MSREIEIVVPAVKERERLDVYLTRHVENATRSKVQQAIRRGFVSVNGKIGRPAHRVSAGEVIRVSLPAPPPSDVLPEAIPLEILYEDQRLLVVNKPAGMVTHPAYGNYSGTLVNALLHHCSEGLSGSNGPTRPGIVHRLDKDTSGLMVVAKDDATHAALARQFFNRTIDREYWALVWGRMPQGRSGLIEAALGRSKADRKKVAVTGGGKAAATEYEVIEAFEFLSLLRLRLRTGRTHQIRVHLHHIGHPVFGDPTYGGRRIAWGPTDRKRTLEVRDLLGLISRQALHAKTIGFVHPGTGKRIKFDSPLPADMEHLLQSLHAPVAPA